MLKYKNCSICNIKQEIINFYTKGSQCKSCLIDKQKKYYNKNKIITREKTKQYRIKNKRSLKERRTQYYKKNTDKVLLQQKQYRRDNKEEISKQNKKYRKENKEAIAKNKKKYYEENLEKTKQYQKQYKIINLNKLNSYSRLYQKERRINDICFKLRRDFSRTIHGALKKQLSSKNGRSILNFLQYTIDDLKNHLELLFFHPDNLTIDGKIWMNWNNWGKYRFELFEESDSSTWVWHIDHIIPQSDLPYTSMEDDNFKKCWSLDNLRPLRADINIIEGSTRIRHKVLDE